MKRSLPLILFPLINLAIHLVTYRGYGIFRDELYYIACSRRLAAGYVDHPPLSIFILRGIRELFGESLFAMRAGTAIAAALVVLIVGLLARRLGAGPIGQSLAMMAFLAAPIYWFSGHVYSMNMLDTLIWSLVALLWLGRPTGERNWGLLGLVLGLGLMNKISVLWLGAGLGAALLLTGDRRCLKSRGPWLAGGLSMLIFLPHLMWQMANGGPTLEFIANATGQKMKQITAAEFWLGQMETLTLPVLLWALLGFFWLWRSTADDRHRRRGLAVVSATVFLILIVSGSSRAGYAAAAYTWLLAAGGLAVETLLASRSKVWRRALTTGIALLLVGQTALALPLVLPILPVDQYVAYARVLGVTPSTEERKEVAELPQHFADMFGWREKVMAARQAWESLPADERAGACFVAFNYGVAGALESEALVLALDQPPSAPLPKVISGHNNYWYWPPQGCDGGPWLVMGGDRDELLEAFSEVELVATVKCRPCMPYEDHQPIFLARGPRIGLDQSWPALKHFN